MIPARKRGLTALVVAAWVDRMIRGAFRGVWVRGAPPPADARLVLYANHTGFWDGFVLHALCRAYGWDGYCVADEVQLARYPFLARLGAFSVRRGEPTAVLASLRYARDLLRRPGTAVGIFPEGVLRPWDGTLHPLERGVELLARRSGATCLPLAIRYRFFEHELPDVLIALGTPHAVEPLAGFARRLGALLDEVRDDRPLTDFTPLVRGRLSARERWDAVRRRG